MAAEAGGGEGAPEALLVRQRDGLLRLRNLLLKPPEPKNIDLLFTAASLTRLLG